MTKFLFFILSFVIVQTSFSREASEESEKFPKNLTNKNNINWNAKLATKEGIEYLEIYNQQKDLLLKQASDFAIHGVVSVEAFSFANSKKNYLIALWSKGAHGQNVKIFEPEGKKQILYSYNSSWPISYKIEDDQIIIVATGDMNPDGQPDKEKIIWGLKGLISKKTIKP